MRATYSVYLILLDLIVLPPTEVYLYNSMEQRSSSETNSSAAGQETSAFHETRGSFLCFKEPANENLLSQMNPDYIFTSNFYNIHHHINLPCMPVSPKTLFKFYNKNFEIQVGVFWVVTPCGACDRIPSFRKTLLPPSSG